MIRSRTPRPLSPSFAPVRKNGASTRTVEFTLRDRDLSTVGADGVRRIEPGEARLWIGGGQPEMRDGLAPAAGTDAAFRITSGATLAD